MPWLNEKFNGLLGDRLFNREMVTIIAKKHKNIEPCP